MRGIHTAGGRAKHRGRRWVGTVQTCGGGAAAADGPSVRSAPAEEGSGGGAAWPHQGQTSMLLGREEERRRGAGVSGDTMRGGGARRGRARRAGAWCSATRGGRRGEERRCLARGAVERNGQHSVQRSGLRQGGKGRGEARGGEGRRGAPAERGMALGGPAPVSAGQRPRCLLLRQGKEAVKGSPGSVEYQCQAQSKLPSYCIRTGGYGWKGVWCFEGNTFQL